MDKEGNNSGCGWSSSLAWGRACQGEAAQPEWLGPAASITSAMAVQSQVATASTQEGLRAEVSAAGKEVGLSPSDRLGVTCLCPQDFAQRNSVLAHPIFSALHLAKWVVSLSSCPRRGKRWFATQLRSLKLHVWGQGAKEQYWCAAFSSWDSAYMIRTGSTLDFHRARTCHGDVPSPRLGQDLAV